MFNKWESGWILVALSLKYHLTLFWWQFTYVLILWNRYIPFKYYAINSFFSERFHLEQDCQHLCAHECILSHFFPCLPRHSRVVSITHDPMGCSPLRFLHQWNSVVKDSGMGSSEVQSIYFLDIGYCVLSMSLYFFMYSHCKTLKQNEMKLPDFLSCYFIMAWKFLEWLTWLFVCMTYFVCLFFVTPRVSLKL